MTICKNFIELTEVKGCKMFFNVKQITAISPHGDGTRLLITSDYCDVTEDYDTVKEMIQKAIV